MASFGFVCGFVTVGLLAALAVATRRPFVFPSVGPAAYLFFTAPRSTAASPRNTLIGHAVAVAAGWLCLFAFGLTDAGPVYADGMESGRALAAALSMALTSAAMLLLRASHPPALATTLTVSLGVITRPADLAVLLAGILLVTGLAVAVQWLAGVPSPWRTPSPAVPERRPAEPQPPAAFGATRPLVAPPPPARPAPAPGGMLRHIGSGAEFPLNGATVTLGAAPDNDIVLPDPLAAPRHARIRFDGAGYWLDDGGSAAGSWLNNARVEGAAPLRPGDRIAIGVTEFQFALARATDEPRPAAAWPAASSEGNEAADAAAPQLARRLFLEAVSGDLRGVIFPVGEGGATLGRALENGVAIMDERLSRRHARIEFREGVYWLSDLGSTNGTYLNSERVTAPRPLQPGDMIELGSTRLLASLER